MTNRIRDWWDSSYDRVNDLMPWHHRGRSNNRPNTTRWPSYHCKKYIAIDTELLLFVIVFSFYPSLLICHII